MLNCKGTHAAVLRAFAFARSNPWYLKLDVRKYYDSIDHDILFSLLERKFKDSGLLYLMYRLLDSYHTAPGKGLPIGNLTSQHWANHYLAAMDHYVKDELRIPAYVRYMDDMVVFSEDKARLLTLRPLLAGFLEERLALSLKIADIGTLSRGLPFLGFTIKDSGIYLSKRSRDRFRAAQHEQQYRVPCRAHPVAPPRPARYGSLPERQREIPGGDFCQFCGERSEKRIDEIFLGNRQKCRNIIQNGIEGANFQW